MKRRKGWWTNKKNNRWLPPWQENNAWSKMTESVRLTLPFKSKLLTMAKTTCLLIFRLRWMKVTTMSRWWTRWSSNLRFALYVIASLKKTKSSNKIGSRSRRDLTWWWKLSAWKPSKPSTTERRGQLKRVSAASKSLSTKSPHAKNKDRRSRRSSSSRRPRCYPISRKSDERTQPHLPPRNSKLKSCKKRLQSPINNLWKRRKLLAKRTNVWITRLQSSKERKMNVKSRRQKRPSVSRRRRNVRFRGSEICKSALTIDKPNLMPKERRRPMKRLSLSTGLGRRQSYRSSRKMFRTSTLDASDNSPTTMPASSKTPLKSVNSTWKLSTLRARWKLGRDKKSTTVEMLTAPTRLNSASRWARMKNRGRMIRLTWCLRPRRTA